MPTAAIRSQLVTLFDAKLVDELLASHAEVKRNFYLGGLRLAEVEGGRFCEAAFRILQQRTTGTFTPIGTQLDTEKAINALLNLPKASFPESIRIHIPRALRLVYDIRNKRDAAHLGDGIDPNLQDSTLVLSVVDWILAEFLRIFHSVNADEAHKLVDQIVTRAVPAIEDFAGFPKVLRTSLKAGDYILLLLYHKASNGCLSSDLIAWVKPAMRKNIKSTLSRLEHEKNFVHSAGDVFQITRLGQAEVERRHLLEMSAF